MIQRRLVFADLWSRKYPQDHPAFRAMGLKGGAVYERPHVDYLGDRVTTEDRDDFHPWGEAWSLPFAHTRPVVEADWTVVPHLDRSKR